MKPRPQVGQTLYRLNIGNAARNCEQVLVPVEVKKVGRKYFTCERVDNEWDRETEHLLDTWEERSYGYSARCCLYETEQEYIDEVEKSNLANSIREIFIQNYRVRGFDLSQLRRIMAIIDEG